MQLKDKTIIVTGASSGIGAATALVLASKGANLVLGARRKTELDQLVGQITQSNGNAVCLPGDVSDETYAKRRFWRSNTVLRTSVSMRCCRAAR